MTSRFLLFTFASLLILGSCSSPTSLGDDGPSSSQEQVGGVLTAGEWNDLENWDFWQDLLKGEFKEMPDYWQFYTDHRISLEIVNTAGKPVIDAAVVIKMDEEVEWQAKTDNKGKAELWISLHENHSAIETDEFELYVNEEKIQIPELSTSDLNYITTSNSPINEQLVDLVFTVDATGSMGDEISFLQLELQDVIQRIVDSSSVKVRTASVFYKDEGDDYLTRVSEFTDVFTETVGFIHNQSAGGGGDFPEAVDEALRVSLELEWSPSARARILFLLLDAPPHYSQSGLDEIHELIHSYAEKGIKLVPIVASGINKKTEFLMRYFSIVTNGSYVFITGDSGIGDEHLVPSVGEYEVEYLNDLMVRLIREAIQ